MALYTCQSLLVAGTTPVPITPAASDTISGSDIGTSGVILRVTTTGTATNVSISDPNLTDLGNAGTVVPVAVGATAVAMILVPPSAVNNAASPPVATVSYSGTRTGVSVEAYRKA